MPMIENLEIFPFKGLERFTLFSSKLLIKTRIPGQMRSVSTHSNLPLRQTQSSSAPTNRLQYICAQVRLRLQPDQSSHIRRND